VNFEPWALIFRIDLRAEEAIQFDQRKGWFLAGASGPRRARSNGIRVMHADVFFVLLPKRAWAIPQ